MAHLRRCWCGKQYRCEASPHSSLPATFEHDDHDKCPDYSFHGFGGLLNRGDQLFLDTIEDALNSARLNEPVEIEYHEGEPKEG